MTGYRWLPENLLIQSTRRKSRCAVELPPVSAVPNVPLRLVLSGASCCCCCFLPANGQCFSPRNSAQKHKDGFLECTIAPLCLLAGERTSLCPVLPIGTVNPCPRNLGPCCCCMLNMCNHPMAVVILQLSPSFHFARLHFLCLTLSSLSFVKQSTR